MSAETSFYMSSIAFATGRCLFNYLTTAGPKLLGMFYSNSWIIYDDIAAVINMMLFFLA